MFFQPPAVLCCSAVLCSVRWSLRSGRPKRARQGRSMSAGSTRPKEFVVLWEYNGNIMGIS